MRCVAIFVSLSWKIGVSSAWGHDPVPNDYLNLSFTGDGATPSAMEVFEQQARKLASLRAASSVSNKGDASYSVPVPLPPALRAPEVGLAYSSQGGGHSYIARGWSIDAGMQMTRITGAAASHAYDSYAEVYRIGGGGLSGLVVPFGSGWKYVSTGPIAVSVSRGTDGAFTVVAGGVTTRLEADDTVTWDTTTQPTTWHTTSSRDASGNAVDYAWSGARLESIRYGGATDSSGAEVPGEEHLIEVSFVYAPRAHASYQAQDGHLDVIGDQLQSVVIASRYGLTDYETQGVVTLTYGDVDAESMLLAIDQESVDGLETRLLAVFEYSLLPDPETATSMTDSSIPVAAYTTNSSRTPGAPSWSDTSTGLFDLSGDGLAEVLEAGESWVGRWYLWDDGDASWDGGRELELPGDIPCGFDGPEGCDYDGESFERTYTVRCDDDYAKSISARRVLDVDGDGFLDVVQIAADAPIPSGYYPGTSTYPAPTPLCDEPESAALSETEAYPWTVWFGNADGFADASVVVDAPVDVPRMSISPVTKERASETVPSTDEVETTVVDMLDMDADGWVDVVHVSEDATTGVSELVVYFHEGWRGGGWSAIGVAVTADTGLSGVLGSLESTEQDVVTGEYQIPGADWQQVAARVDAVHVVRALRDLNGDGVLDFVDASDWTALTPNWEVWLGTGRRDGVGFSTQRAWSAPGRDLSLTDEGWPAVLTCSVPIEHLGEGSSWTDGLEHPPAIMAGVESGGGSPLAEFPEMSCGFADGIPGSMAWDDHGRAQKQTVGLIDMDADGRPDLVDLREQVEHPSGRWWRNLGDAYSAAARDAPSWFGGALNASISRQIVAVDPTYLVGAPIAPAEEGPVYPSNGFRLQLWSVLDVDRDGLPDLYDGFDAQDESDTAGITYGARAAAGAQGWARPGVLVAITGTHGARTELAYASSSRMSPSGEDSPHQMSAHHDVVASMVVSDPVSGNAARQDYAWSGGVSERGQFVGFGRQVVRNAVHDADVHGQATFQHLSTTDAEFLLDRDYVLPTTTEIYLNAVNPSVTAAPVAAVDRLDQRIVRNYATVAFTDGATTIATSWLAAQVVTDYPENSADAERSSTVGFTRDSYGHATEIAQSVADCAAPPTSLGGLPAGSGAYSCLVRHQDDEKVEIAYVHDAANTHFVPSSITTSGWDATTASWEPVERGDFRYDGGAFGASIAAGLLTRQDVRVDPATAAGALSWAFTRDARGAITQMEAPGGRVRLRAPAYGHALAGEEENGEGHVVSWSFDALGRQTQTIDANGVASRTAFDAFGRPRGTWITPVGGSEYRTTTTTYDDTWGAAYIATLRSTYAAVGGSPVMRHERQVLDGFGDPIQTWRPAEAIGSWIVEETIRDVQGNAVRTSYPHRETAFSPDFAYTRDARFATWSALDAYGRPHETWADYDAGLGEQSYDARSRVTGFLDANANAYSYDYDGLGRLREVARDSAVSGIEDWYAYEYEGPDPVEMWEGGFGGTLAATWTYDTMGRPLEKALLNRDTGLYDAFTWSWDAQWKGARDTITDPSGQTDYTYAAGSFGSFGHPTNVTRTWATSEVAAFDTEYDFEGRAIAVTWPTGAVVESTYSATGWLTAQDVAWSGGTAHVAATYDDFGLPSGWTGGEAGVPGGLFVSAITRASPTQLAETAWTMPDGSAREMAYTWADNGMLTRKSITRAGAGPPPSVTHLDYGYDEWQRLESITNPGGLLEGYAYDPLGNLTEMQHGPRTYMYSAGPFSEVAGRMSDLGEHTTHTWDAQGRMTSLHVVGGTADTHNSYDYDGAGRLVRVERDAMGAPHVTTTYGYDVDDQLVYETRGTDSVLRFNGYRSEGAGTVEKLLPMVSLEDGALRWTQTEPDGHAIATYASTGAEVSTSVMGGYGLPIAETGAAWKIDGFHGVEPDGGNQVAHMGARHMLVRDGTWMQPEPLLYLGPTNGDLRRPLGYGGVYSGGNPIQAADRSGYYWETGWDVASLVMGAASYVNNVSQGNYGDAALDAVGIVIDAVAVATPVPGGAGMALKAVRYGDEAASLVVTGAKYGDEVAAAAKASPCSFVAGTSVLTPDGAVSIESLRSGATVLAYDDAQGLVARLVVGTFSHHDTTIELALRGADGELDVLITTDRHPFWVVDMGTYVASSALSPGMRLLTFDGREAVVETLASTGISEVVYNFEVASEHNYFVAGWEGGDGVLVHNACMPGGAPKALPDSAQVCRGGTCESAKFETGSGVTIDESGKLQGVSVNSAPGASVKELSSTIPNNQVGVSTVGDVRAAGGSVVPSPTPKNPNHATLGGITPEKAQELFTPTVRNPNK